MDRFIISILLLASVIGPMTCVMTANNGLPGGPVEPTSTAKPNTTTISPPTPPPTNATTPKTTTTTAPSTTNGTTTTPAPITPSPKTTTPEPSPKTTTPEPSPKTTTPTPSPHSSTTPAPPSDRKFEAFSFIGGFALAIGLVAIAFLAWKLYISRRENVYHTL